MCGIGYVSTLNGVKAILTTLQIAINFRMSDAGSFKYSNYRNQRPAETSLKGECQGQTRCDSALRSFTGTTVEG